jgi:hypothetical protein
METGLTVSSAEKTPLLFKGSYGGEEYRKEGTEHSGKEFHQQHELNISSNQYRFLLLQN